MQKKKRIFYIFGGVDTLENEGRCSVNIIDFGEDTLKSDGKCSNMNNLLGVDALKRG